MMERIFNSLWIWVRFILAPESTRRRVLAGGLQRENLPVWYCLSAVFLIYQKWYLPLAS